MNEHGKRKWLLDLAADKVLGSRQDDHGSPADSFELIAKYWAIHLDTTVTAGDVAIMMTLLKLARLRGNPDHFDSAIDAAGYMACFVETRPGLNDNSDPDVMLLAYAYSEQKDDVED